MKLCLYNSNKMDSVEWVDTQQWSDCDCIRLPNGKIWYPTNRLLAVSILLNARYVKESVWLLECTSKIRFITGP
jgi:hypothetical protein